MSPGLKSDILHGNSLTNRKQPSASSHIICSHASSIIPHFFAHFKSFLSILYVEFLLFLTRHFGYAAQKSNIPLPQFSKGMILFHMISPDTTNTAAMAKTAVNSITVKTVCITSLNLFFSMTVPPYRWYSHNKLYLSLAAFFPCSICTNIVLYSLYLVDHRMSIALILL